MPETRLESPTVASRLFAADLDVLGELGLPLTEGGARPTFGSDLWDLSAVLGIPVSEKLPSQMMVDWTRISSPRLRVAAMEVAMVQMQPRLADRWHLANTRRTPLKPQWLSRQIGSWARWLNWLHEIG